MQYFHVLSDLTMPLTTHSASKPRHARTLKRFSLEMVHSVVVPQTPINTPQFLSPPLPQATKGALVIHTIAPTESPRIRQTSDIRYANFPPLILSSTSSLLPANSGRR